MTRRLIVRPAAEADVVEAFRWYEARSPGLGAEFIRELEACFARIETNPEIYAEQYRHARRALLRRFPYAVFYVIQPDTVDVIACFHARRDPRRWRARV